MRGLIKHLTHTILATLLSAAGLPVWAAAHTFSYCDVSGPRVVLSNVNLNADESAGTTVFENTHTIQYDCHVTAAGGLTFYPTLIPDAGGKFQGLITLLQGLGLAMDITIRESGGSPQTVNWTTLKSGGWKKQFGAVMPTDDKHGGTAEPDYYYRYHRSADITLKLYLETKYKENNLVKTVPPQNDLLYIMADPAATTEKGKGIDTTGFNIRVLSPGLGRVEINPTTVHLGHFIKTSDATLTRHGDFTVTARQVLRPAPGQSFELPLNIRFNKGALSATTDNQHLALKNTGDAEDNGLQLSIKDKDTGTPVTFGENTLMGKLSVTPSGALTNNIIKNYTIEVNRRSGMDVKAGKFTGAITAEITYN